MTAAADERRRIVLAWAFARIDVAAFVAANAAVCALLLFAVTLGLVLKSAPAGVPVGPNLVALATYFPGYSVTVAGAFVGAVYASIVGALAGAVIALLWNAAHALLLGVIRFRANLAAYSID